MVSISRITLHRRRLELGLGEEQNYSDIDDGVLDEALSMVEGFMFNCGG